VVENEDLHTAYHTFIIEVALRPLQTSLLNPITKKLKKKKIIFAQNAQNTIQFGT